jgi:hypothetical protein
VVSRARATPFPARATLAGGWIALLGLVALALLAQRDAPLGLSGRASLARPWTVAPDAGYRAQALALMERTRSTLAAGDRLLDQRDADPRLGTDPAWAAAYGGTVDALAAEYRSTLGLSPGRADGELHACVTESLRLLSTGHALLREGFQADGHRAYNRSSHGNWDVNLGVIRLRSCEAMAQTAG